MKRIWGLVVSLLAAGTAVMPACATNDQTIFVNGALAPSTNRTGGSCVYSSDPQQLKLFQGRFDVGISDTYSAVLLVGNQLISRGDPNNNRAESNRVHINGGSIRVTEPGGAPLIGRAFSSLATGFADPQQNNAPGYTAIGLVVVDKETRDVLAAQLPLLRQSKTVLINVKVFGTSLGGEDIESAEYQLPMQVCNGCLVDFSSGYDPTSKTQPLNCDKPLGSGSGTVLPCSAGQDESTPCQLCSSRKACNPSLP